MGAGKKVAMGCGGVLFLAVLALYLGYNWVKKNHGMTWVDSEVLMVAEEVLPVVVPERFDPLFAVYTEEGLIDPLAMFLDSKSRTSETTLILFSRTGTYTFEQMVEDFDTSDTGSSGIRIDVGEELEDGEERFPVLYRGETYEAVLKEGMRDNEGTLTMQRNLITIIPQGERTIMVLLDGPAEDLPSTLMQEILSNVREPASAGTATD